MVTDETDLWDVVVPPLPLLLLQLDGDSADGTALDPLHQVRHIPEAHQQNALELDYIRLETDFYF